MAESSASRLLSLSVHDLRNAINTIQLSVHLLQSAFPEPSVQLRGDVEMLDAGVRQARQMVETLGAFTRLHRDHKNLRIEPMLAQRILQEVLTSVSKATESGDRISLEVRSHAPEQVELDETLARMALEQVIRNALSSSKEGAVVVRSDGVAGLWRIAVANEERPPRTIEAGPISVDRIEHILGTSSQRRGLDLAIAAEITRRFHGQIWLDVEPEHRSEVVLDWPISVAHGDT